MYTEKRINVNNLVMWKNNVRYNFEMADEYECVEAILNLADGKKKFDSLLSSVVSQGYFFEAMIVFNDPNNGLIVLDGNRRMTLFRINNYPTLIKDYGLTTTNIEEFNKLKFPKILCYVYNDINQAYNHIENRHQGQQDGEGTVQWEPSGKQRMKEIRGDRTSLGYRVINLFANSVNLDYTFVKNNIKNVSTIERILKYKYVYAKFGIQNSNQYDLDNEEHVEKLNELLTVFYKKSPNGNVRDVISANLVEDMFKDLKPIEVSGIQQISLPLSSDVKEKEPVKKGAKNKYKKDEISLFSWRNEGIIVNDNIFKKHLETLVSLEISSTSTHSQSLEYLFRVSPFFYRVLLDVAISEFTKYVLIDNNRKSFNCKSKLFEPFNTTSDGKSMVNTNKICGILELSKCVKTKNKVLLPYIRILNRKNISSKNQQAVELFVVQLNEVVHGSVLINDPTKLQRFDIITLNLLKIISVIIN